MCIISEKEIREYLNNDEIEIFLFDSIDSTNNEAKRKIKNGLKNDAIFIAREQTAGRGRQGKSFYSPLDSGFYFTAVLHPENNIEEIVGITTAAAVVVVDALKNQTKKHPKIKWVNDIYIDEKKVCGILAESVFDFEKGKSDAVIIGIGINLTTEIFPDEISSIAGSIGSAINKSLLAAELFKGLKNICSDLVQRKFMEDYRRYSMILGREIRFFKNGANHKAIATDITHSGELKVITEKGEEMLLNSGEISIKF